MAKKLKVGIIGTGGIANAHLNSYLRMEDEVEIVGGSDIVSGKAREFFDKAGLTKVKAFDNNTDLLKLGLDAVSICTYNTTHAECTIAALEAGVHVLCEKPMSVTLEDAIKMYNKSKETGKILTIGFQPRYDPNMDLVRDIVRSGTLGDIYYIQTGGGRRRGMPGGTFIRKELSGVVHLQTLVAILLTWCSLQSGTQSLLQYRHLPLIILARTQNTALKQNILQ